MPNRKRFFYPSQTSWPAIGLVRGEGQGGVPPPGAFTVGQWTATATGVSGVIQIVVSALPSGTPLTDIEWSTDNGSNYSSSGLTTTGSFDLIGLTDAVSYNIKIRAVNAGGTGPGSDTKARAPLTGSAPSAFTIGMWSVADLATVGDARVTISSLPSDGGGPITLIQYRLNGGSWVTSGIITTGTFDIAGLVDGVSTTVELRAVNAVGAGTDSDDKSVTTTSGSATAPAQFGTGDWSIADLNTVDDARITITALPSNGGTAITDLQYQVGAGSWTSLGGTSTGTYDIGGLTYNTSAAVGIRAVNLVGNGTGSATKNVTPTGSAETDAVAAAFTTPPTTARALLIQTFIAALKTASIWTKIDALWVIAAADSQAAKINWKNPGSLTLTLGSVPTFSADRGYTTDGTDDYLDTGYIPSSFGGQLTQDSAHLSVRSRTASQQDKTDIGTGASGTNQLFGAVFGAGAGANSGLRLNTSGLFSSGVTPGASGVGLFHFNRSASNSSEGYKDGSSFVMANTTAASTGLPTASVYIGGRHNQAAVFAAREYASASIGGSLNSTEVAAYAAAELAYMQAVGAA